MTAGHVTADNLGPPATMSSPVHRVDPLVKLVCLLAFLFAVVATPPPAIWAFGVHAALVAVVVVAAAIPRAAFLRGLAVELPFVAFAVALPFVGRGPDQEILGVALSVPGLWAAWAILAKATLGTAGAVVLARTTAVAEILHALERLRVPRALVAIAGFMVRYLDVVTGELRRMHVARVSRGDDPRWLWQCRSIARTAGAVFVRAFERGERVQHAMAARGFTGRFPATATNPPYQRWMPAAAVPVFAWTVAVAAVAT